MDLKRKLAGLKSAGPGSQPVANVRVDAPPIPDESPRADAASPECEADKARLARIAELRGRLHTMMARPARSASAHVSRREAEDLLPFNREPDASGVAVFRRTRTYDVTQRHGTVPLHTALAIRGDAVATLALDRGLATFDPPGALFLDTETNGLSGGTGVMAFLIGVGRFDGGAFRVEQFFLSDPGHERAMLARLAERIEGATSLVTFNGKAFDMPLLRSRYVMARLPAPREPPHLDLVHAARRIYGSRLEQCKLTSLERDVLGFVRENDVPSGEIPARYAQYLRAGDAAGLLSVIEHNLWDVIAMAALVGELGARISGSEGTGRCEPMDLAGFARTAQRAGADGLAVSLADDAAQAGAKLGQSAVAVRARRLSAEIHRRRKDHLSAHRHLLDALAHAPDDPAVHLALAKLYEHRLRDPVRALDHAVRALEAEDYAVWQRRLSRLQRRIERSALPLLERGISSAQNPNPASNTAPASSPPIRTT